jgi:Tfp pilus assembly protein PilX
MADARRARTDDATRTALRSEDGFALILALLALMLLTFLGLTLATSTSTELKIATNYRWQQQALYNAEAGVEAGKRILSGLTNWTPILPTKRTTSWDGNTAPPSNRGGANATYNNNDAWSNATRNWENGPCDKRGDGVGYGAILDDATTLAPYQYKTTIYGQSLNGAFTLWVRRPTMIKDDGTVVDYSGNGDEDHLVLVSEGVAPYTGAQLSSASAGNAAVQVVEVLLSKVTPSSQGACGTRAGQSGQGSLGAGFSACDAVTSAGLTSALGAAGTGGRGTLGENTVK